MIEKLEQEIAIFDGFKMQRFTKYHVENLILAHPFDQDIYCELYLPELIQS